MKTISRAKSKVVGVAMAAMLAASPLAVISMSMVTGCGGGCLPPIPCECRLQFGAGLLAIWLLRSGGENVIGRPGLNCWDLNANRVCDTATEDINADGVCDALDCQGPPGEEGQNVPAIDGINCWDLNANGANDPAEDINGDGEYNAYDCRGPAGPPGKDGQDGQDGQDGKDGDPARFDQFIEDFFTYGEISDDVSGQGEVIQIYEPVFSNELESYGPVAFRFAIPEIYNEGKPVTIRLFLWRDSYMSVGCTTLRLDIFRMVPNGGIARYGAPVWLRLEPGMMTNPGMLVVDLPLNTATPTGLGFPNDFFARQMLAFELSVYDDGEFVGMDADYTILGAEAFESASAASTSISGVTVFDDDDVISFCYPEEYNY